jgi:hypothetical protein|tara:strand:- start:11 stop:661 length:651 start_codon:yes stop_codon:yes gene_type:complete
MNIGDIDQTPFTDSYQAVDTTDKKEYNSLGHRCKDIADLDFDNYVLFTGCSHTVGVGVTLKQSFPYKVAKKLKCDYYNLGVGGSGVDTIEHNLLVWFTLFDKPPKYIFCEWPDYARFMSQLPGYENMLPAGSWSYPEFLVTADYPLQVKEELVYKLINNLSPCPIIDIRHSALGLAGENPYTIWHFDEDTGTDGLHPGPKSHKATAEKIIDYLNTR